MIQPLKPSDLQTNEIPQSVINVVNDLLIKKWNGVEGSSITIMLSSVDDGFKLINSEYPKWWLNFEKVYESSGWDVTYYNHCGGDDFGSHYEFKPKAG